MSTKSPSKPVTDFSLPPASAATAPPERRGLARDAVRLLVARPSYRQHAEFKDLPDHLEEGDLLVVNTSATLPAATDGVRGHGAPAPVHLAGELDDGSWVIEVRRPDNAGPQTDLRVAEQIALVGRVTVSVQASYPEVGVSDSRLWRVTQEGRYRPLVDYLNDHGRPIRYGYLSGSWPLRDVQTVYADVAGSAEMPSAGRPLTLRLLARLMAKGVTVTPVVLHTGVSSPEKHEPPMPERFLVPEVTGRLVNSARSAGRRVVAVGTTVVRALESVAAPDGRVEPGRGWTDLVIGPRRPVRVVSGMVTGLHEPEASHLLMLEAVAGPDLVRAAYADALAEHYLWHEFGDSMLLLP
ncbi:MAG: S-adenosylmethionine:tRNA ribosyltransferase-isomerase [Nocardioidaceae bacterium]